TVSWMARTNFCASASPRYSSTYFIEPFLESINGDHNLFHSSLDISRPMMNSTSLSIILSCGTENSALDGTASLC
ncbi:MAG: hypothetical protein KDH90_06805, partial [Anaerolineae bacterium]|nr:hypothetical protein [Anaerolineae bacterium]